MSKRPSGNRVHLVSNRVAITEERIRCYELRLKGLPFHRIAEETGLAQSTVHKRVTDEIASRVLPLAEEVRKMELDRLNRWLEKLTDEVEAGRSVARNIEVAVKVSERIAKYMGADAPVQVEATVTQLTQEDVALAELVNEANAKAAAEESALRAQD